MSGCPGDARPATARKQAEEDLRLAHEKALEASRLKTELLANVSHVLRTPLNAILGYTEMLQDGVYGPLSTQQRTGTAEIIDSTGRLLDFINNLLSQAEIDSGRVVLNIVNFSPADLLDSTHSTVGAIALSKGLTLTTSIASEVPAVVPGDPYWLRQVLVTMVSNALKFTEAGSLKIEVFCPDANHWAQVGPVVRPRTPQRVHPSPMGTRRLGHPFAEWVRADGPFSATG